MIISFILGGLGNQCFQYALGRQLAYMQQVPLRLETSGYKLPKYARHPYILEKFNINATRARFTDFVRPATQVFRGRSITWERATGGFDPGILDIKHSTVLVGYWQSAKYFGGVADLIRKELTLKDPPSSATRDMAAVIDAATEAVSVHVRRRDYVTDQKNVAIFEQCSLDYYRAAMAQIARTVLSPHFFVFSDDSSWTKKNLHSDFPLTYVEHNNVSSAHEDLMLMRGCKHNIIANSTFSWWGAWLNDNANKVVVAPRRWFKSHRILQDDLLPDEWIRL